MMPGFKMIQLTFLLMFLFLLTSCAKDYDLNPFTTVLRMTIENNVNKVQEKAVEESLNGVVYDE